jgi:hypothetical protein
VYRDEVMPDRRIDALVELGDEVVTQPYGYLVPSRKVHGPWEDE